MIELAGLMIGMVLGTDFEELFQMETSAVDLEFGGFDGCQSSFDLVFGVVELFLGGGLQI